MLTNFQQLNTIFDIDHVPFNDATAANRGKHDQSTYIELAVDATTAINEVAVYSKDDGAGNTRLYLRQESAGTVIQMSDRDPVVAASGETFLPGGLLIKWGQIAAATNAVAQAFPTAFPNNCFSVTVTENIATALSNIGVNGFTAANFTFRTSAAGAVPITYLAIGN